MHGDVGWFVNSYHPSDRFTIPFFGGKKLHLSFPFCSPNLGLCKRLWNARLLVMVVEMGQILSRHGSIIAVCSLKSRVLSCNVRGRALMNPFRPLCSWNAQKLSCDSSVNNRHLSIFQWLLVDSQHLMVRSSLVLTLIRHIFWRVDMCVWGRR